MRFTLPLLEASILVRGGGTLDAREVVVEVEEEEVEVAEEEEDEVDAAMEAPLPT
jgi:hypothetical protein